MAEGMHPRPSEIPAGWLAGRGYGGVRPGGGPQRVPPLSEIAVLCRTHHQLDLLEKCLRHGGIPCLIGREGYLWHS